MDAIVYTKYNHKPDWPFGHASVIIDIGGIKFEAEESVIFVNNQPAPSQDLADVEALARAIAERFNTKGGETNE